MDLLAYENVTTTGELETRQSLLYSRLESDIYRPNYIFSADKNGWPGDWEGRTILALVSLSNITKKKPLYIEEIIDELQNHLNSKGYLGPIHQNIADEQQLSGHSWLLRGLCEYYIYSKDNRVLSNIKDIIINLFLPIKKLFTSYPILPSERVYKGKEAGNIAGKVSEWLISSDTGCAFIPLDGVSHALEILSMYCNDNETVNKTNELLDVMITNFMKIPFLEISVQTHATLTGLRGLLRIYIRSGDSKLLDFTRSIFDLYINEGMTSNYSNYNWFKRPLWTEPCAIIDSFMVACQLFSFTKEPIYAEYTQNILYNGIYRSQRGNGGFGTDMCAGAGTDFLANSQYEAYWCCTMRGGEGLLAASIYSILSDNDDIIMLYPQSGVYSVLNVKFSVYTEYPYSDKIIIIINEFNRKDDITLKIFTHSNIEKVMGDIKYSDEYYAYVTITKDTKEINIQMECSLKTQESVGNNNIKNMVLLMHGPLILGSSKRINLLPNINEIVSLDKCIYSFEDFLFRPLNDTYLKDRKTTENEKVQILFNKKVTP